MTASNRLFEFVSAHVDELQSTGGSYSSAPIGLFELMPHDYLDFAEKALVQYSEAQDIQDQVRLAIECIAHAKRAIDCQLETFCEFLGLRDLMKKRGGGVPARLELVRRIGIFEGRALDRLNKIRNADEHDFARSTITDLDAFHDLAVAFVAVLDAAMSGVFGNDLEIQTGSEYGATNYYVRFKYDSEASRINVNWYQPAKPDEATDLTVDSKNFDDLVYMLRVMYALRQVGWGHDASRIRKAIQLDPARAIRKT